MLTSSQRQLLRVISESGPLSRTVLAASMGLSKAAMSGIARDLITLGVLHETETVYGQGRPSILLDLHPQGAFFVGISLLEDPAPMVLSDLNGKIIARENMPLSRDPEVIARLIADALPKLLAGRPDVAAKLSGLGVALSGFVDEKQANCVQSTLLGWQDVPLAKIIRQKTGIETFIENDAKAIAVSEKLFGTARDIRNFSVVSLGDGVGCAHFIRGKLYRGNHGGAGEIAHCTIEPNGSPCRCGKRGCLDTVASINAIKEMSKAEGLSCTSLTELEEEASAGNAVAIRILHRAGGALGLAIAHLIQFNDPGMILITHVEGNFDGLFGTLVQQAIEANVLPRYAGQTPIRTQRVNGDIWARGAASIAAHNFLISPNPN
ncbi:ROK family transcriptional regulator [Rhizobium sp. CNPSo 3464]|uniref:ROK family transcriptional regulator n=1 Tax=Rhizobium sp. CNPSo 3464 TaxID=3021406 RepID=UPI00254E5725|nr:ROK family transcriptional regulator [Rhizobium sp. CNPSo 3464]MDK4740062.1 ROK family transcriptional regulator [Rhizobium sp. CNPSo 3464]